MTQSTTATCTTGQRGESSSLLGKMRLPGLLRPVSWLYATGSEQDSVGRFLGTVQFKRIIFPVRLSCWEATGPARREFANRLGVEIAEYLDSNSELCESGSIFHMSLYMVGVSASRAKPTVMFVSGDAKVRKDAFKIIKQSGILDDYPGFALAHISLEAEYKDFRQLGGVEGGGSINLSKRASTEPATMKIFTTKDDNDGARRLYFLDRLQSDEQRRTATAGGIVSFEGKPMFLTVYHATSGTSGSDTQIQLHQDVSADDECEITGFGDLDLASDDNLVATTSRGSQSPESSLSSGDDASSIFTSATETNLSGNPPLKSPTRNQPAATPRDPPTFDKATVDAGGIVFSSSEWDSLLINVDWTLLPDARLRQNASETGHAWIPLENYSAHVELEARDAQITAATPDKGTVGGLLSGTPSFVRLPFSKKFQQVYMAKFEKPLVPGDCGSWVRDAATGKLFGHVVAGSPSTGLATIIPAHRLFAHLLSELEAGGSKKSRTSAVKPPRKMSLGNPDNTEAKPSIRPESKKRRASGALQGLWSSFKKSAIGKGVSVDTSEEKKTTQAEDSTPTQIDTSVAKSTPITTTAPVLQDGAISLPIAVDGDNQRSSPKRDVGMFNLFPESPILSNPSSLIPTSASIDPPYPAYDKTSVFPPYPNVIENMYNIGSSPSFPDDGPVPFPGAAAEPSSNYDCLFPQMEEEWLVKPQQLTCSSEHPLLPDDFMLYDSFRPSSLGNMEFKIPMSIDPSFDPPDVRGFTMSSYSNIPYPSPAPTSVSSASPALSTRPTSVYSGSPALSTRPGESECDEKNRCPHSDCGNVFKDLRAHMLTHQRERPEKCPIVTCEYHVKGFARKYDKNRHALTHYKGTMVCGFCPGAGSTAERSFNRADVFKRHLNAVHGVEQTVPNSRKKTSGPSTAASKKLTSYPSTGTGRCSTCPLKFGNAQSFYEHLDDCVLRAVVQQQEDDPAEAVNARRLAEVEDASDVETTPEKNHLPVNMKAGATSHEKKHSEEGEDGDKGDEDGSGYGGSDSLGAIRLPTTARGRKNHRDYPSSWGFDKGQMTMKKRVMAVFGGVEGRIAKDDMIPSAEHEVRVKLSDGKSYVTDLDVQTLRRAEDFLTATEEEKEPRISDDMVQSTEHEIRVKLSDGKSYVTDLDVQTLRRAEGFLAASEDEKERRISYDPTDEQTKEMVEMSDADVHETDPNHE